jgi:hypothetical protein
MTTRKVPEARHLAAATLTAALDGRPWEQSHPVQVTEVYHLDIDDPRNPTRYVLAAGHDTQQVIALAASAPHFDRGLPDAVIIETPGSMMANPHGDPNDPATMTVDVEPIRGARVIAATIDGIGGAMVAELIAGPSPVTHGPHDPDLDEPLVEMITALWMARRVDDSTRRAILDRLPNEIDDHEGWRDALERTQDLRPPDPRPRWRTQYRADVDETGDDE